MSAAIEAGVVREIFATRTASHRHAELLESSGLSWSLVTDEAGAALSETVTPQGLVAVVPLPKADLTQVLSRPRSTFGRIVVVLVEARDPGNAGTVIRTADAAGADCVVLAGASVDPWSGKCVRSSAGSILHLPVIDGVSVEETLQALRAAGCRIVAADGHASEELHSPAAQRLLMGDHAWLFGNEAHGLHGSVVCSADNSLSVPVYGRAESLNLAAAAAVCLYESARAVRSLTPGG